jgi:hypothetical protein
MNNRRRLPNGDTTEDSSAYLSAWHELANKVLHFFPGYALASFDSGLCFEKRDITQLLSGEKIYKVVDKFELSTAAAMTLAANK